VHQPVEGAPAGHAPAAVELEHEGLGATVLGGADGVAHVVDLDGVDEAADLHHVHVLTVNGTGGGLGQEQQRQDEDGNGYG
jgi:hypothetical protein